MDESPINVRRYIEHLLDEGRVAPGLAEVARTVRPRFSEPSEATDSKGPAGAATYYASLYEQRFDSVKRTGNSHLGFQESIDSLKSVPEQESQIRLLSLHKEGLLFIFFVDIEAERLVGLIFIEAVKQESDE